MKLLLDILADIATVIVVIAFVGIFFVVPFLAGYHYTQDITYSIITTVCFDIVSLIIFYHL